MHTQIKETTPSPADTELFLSAVKTLKNETQAVKARQVLMNARINCLNNKNARLHDIETTYSEYLKTC